MNHFTSKLANSLNFLNHVATCKSYREYAETAVHSSFYQTLLESYRKNDAYFKDEVQKMLDPVTGLVSEKDFEKIKEYAACCRGMQKQAEEEALEEIEDLKHSPNADIRQLAECAEDWFYDRKITRCTVDSDNVVDLAIPSDCGTKQCVMQFRNIVPLNEEKIKQCAGCVVTEIEFRKSDDGSYTLELDLVNSPKENFMTVRFAFKEIHVEILPYKPVDPWDKYDQSSNDSIRKLAECAQSWFVGAEITYFAESPKNDVSLVISARGGKKKCRLKFRNREPLDKNLISKCVGCQVFSLSLSENEAGYYELKLLTWNEHKKPIEPVMPWVFEFQNILAEIMG